MDDSCIAELSTLCPHMLPASRRAVSRDIRRNNSDVTGNILQPAYWKSYNILKIMGASIKNYGRRKIFSQRDRR